jgi:exonuclease SbcC
MKLIHLNVQGFKRLRNHEFTFTDGLNVIVGDNAAGKSTLLQAIECALYGAVVVPGKKEHIITWGQKSWKVELKFAVGDLEYLLTRTKSTAKLECGDAETTELVANGATPVTQAVEELLGLSAKDYNLFMQSKQGETSGVLTFGAAALNRKVEAFSGISTIDDVQQLALEGFRTAKAKIEAISFDEADLEELKGQRVNAQSNAKVLWFQVEAATQELEAADRPDAVAEPESNPDAMQAHRDHVYRLTQRYQSAKREAATAETHYGEAQQRLQQTDKPEDAHQLANTLAEAKKKASEAAKDVDRLQRDMLKQQSLFSELSAVELAYDQQRSEDDIAEEMSTLVTEKTQLEASGKAAAKKEHELRYRAQQLNDMLGESECPACGTKLSEHDPEKLREEHASLLVEAQGSSDSVKALDRQILQRTKALADLEKELETTQATESKVDKLRDQLVDMGVVLHTGENPTEGELEKAKDLHQSLLAEKSALDHNLSEVEAAQRKYNLADKAEKRALAECTEARHSADRLGAQLAAAKEGATVSDDDIAEARQLWKQYDQRIADLRLEYTERQNDLQRAKQAWESACKESDRLKVEVERLNQRAEQVKQLKVTADKAGRLSKFLGERRAGYLQEVWDAVLASASKQVALASRDMISRLVFKDGDFFFEEDGILAPVSSASGAQKAHIGVAVRIGLSRALYGKNALIIFDEPTESMREHHAIGLSSSLAGAASQCLLITHREQDQDLASNVLEVA